MGDRKGRRDFWKVGFTLASLFLMISLLSVTGAEGASWAGGKNVLHFFGLWAQNGETSIYLTPAEPGEAVLLAAQAYGSHGFPLGAVIKAEKLNSGRTRVLKTADLPAGTASLVVEASGPILGQAILHKPDGSGVETIPAFSPAEASSRLDFPVLVRQDALHKALVLFNPQSSNVQIQVAILDDQGTQLGAKDIPHMPPMAVEEVALGSLFERELLAKVAMTQVLATSGIAGFQKVEAAEMDLLALGALPAPGQKWILPAFRQKERHELWAALGIYNPQGVRANLRIEILNENKESLGIDAAVLEPGKIHFLLSENAGGLLPAKAAWVRVIGDQGVSGYAVWGVMGAQGLTAAPGIPSQEGSGLQLLASRDGNWLSAAPAWMAHEKGISPVLSSGSQGLWISSAEPPLREDHPSQSLDRKSPGEGWQEMPEGGLGHSGSVSRELWKISPYAAYPTKGAPVIGTPPVISPQVSELNANQVQVSKTKSVAFRSLDRRVRVEVPAGAVSEDVTLFYAPSKFKDDGRVVKRFSLNATTVRYKRPFTKFSRPLQIAVPIGNAEFSRFNVQSLRLVFYNPKNRSWDPLPSRVDLRNKQVIGQSEHFTDFGLTGDILTETSAVLEGFQTDLFSGGVGYQYDLLLPPGRGGLTPQLKLQYSSGRINGQQMRRIKRDNEHDNPTGPNWFTCDWRSHGKGATQDGTWVGAGWDLQLGYISRDFASVSQCDGEGDNSTYSLVLNGKSYTLKELCGQKIQVAPRSTNYAGIYIRRYEATNAAFLLIQAYVDNGDPKYWEVRTKDGTRYRFGVKPITDPWASGLRSRVDKDKTWVEGGKVSVVKTYSRPTSYDMATETIRWFLEEVIDTHQNKIDITNEVELVLQDDKDDYHQPHWWHVYARQGYPKRIVYGAGHTVTFVRGSRFFRADHEEKTQNYETERLIRIEVRNPDGSPIRRYVFEYDDAQNMATPAVFCRKSTGEESPGGHPDNMARITRYECPAGGSCDFSNTGGSWQSLPAPTFEYTPALYILPKPNPNLDLRWQQNADPQVRSICGPKPEDCGVVSGAVLDAPLGSKNASLERMDTRFLKKAKNGYGGVVELIYEEWAPYMQGEGGPEGWSRQRVKLKKVYNEDNPGNPVVAAYSYKTSTPGFSSGGQWYTSNALDTCSDSAERHPFIGYNQVTATETDASGTVQIGSRTVNQFRIRTHAANTFAKPWRDDERCAAGPNSTDPNNGLLEWNETYDAQSKLWQRTENTYLDQVVGVSSSWIRFTPLNQKLVRTYDPLTGLAAKESRTRYEYRPEYQGGAQYGNLTTEFQDGDLSDAADDRTVHRQFRPKVVLSTDLNQTVWMVEKTARETVYAGSHWADDSLDVRTRTRYRYDGATSLYWDQPPGTKGELTAVDKWNGKSGNPADGYAASFDTTRYQYDTYGNKRYEWDAKGNMTETTYESTQRFPERVYPPLRNLAKTFSYDVFSLRYGKPAGETDAHGALTSFEYDPFGRDLSLWRPGESKAALHAATTRVEYTINPPGLRGMRVTLKKRDDERGGVGPATYLIAHRFYDGLGRIVQTQSETEAQTSAGVQKGWSVVSVSYDNRGKKQYESAPYFVSDGAGGTYQVPNWSSLPKTTQEYDALGRITKVIGPDGVEIKNGYRLWETAVVDGKGHQKIYRKDAFDRLAEVWEYKGTFSLPAFGTQAYATTRYQYDIQNNLTDVCDATNTNAACNASTADFHAAYDPQGRKISMKDPDLGTWRYEYDANGNIQKQVDARGMIVCSFYDPLNRLKGKTYPLNGVCLESDLNSGAEAARFIYDQADTSHGSGLGRLTRTETVNAYPVYVDYKYDLRGRVMAETQKISGVDYTTYTTYDVMDRPLITYFPDGESLKVKFNEGGLPNYLQSNLYSHYVSATTYNAAGQIKRRTLGNGFTTRFGYFGYKYYGMGDADDVPVTIGSTNVGKQFFGHLGRICTPGYGQCLSWPLNQTTTTALQDLSYWYDTAGNVTAVRDYPDQNRVQFFEYDELDRLVRGYTRLVQNTYDGYYYAYDHTYDYDQLGRITRFGSTGRPAFFTYEDSRHKHAVTRRGSSPYDQDIFYSYDASGNMIDRSYWTSWRFGYNAENRLERARQASDGFLVEFVYDASGKKVMRKDGGGAIVYVGNSFERNLATGQVTKYYSIGGKRVAMRQGPWGQAGKLFYLFTDHLNSIVGTYDTSTGSLLKNRYYPYGAHRFDTEINLTGTPERYTGQKKDMKIGIYDYGARYYDPEIGRFMQPDTIVPDPKNPQDWNRYSYVRNSPLKYTDPSGHNPLLFMAVGAAVGWIGNSMMAGSQAFLSAGEHANFRTYYNAQVRAMFSMEGLNAAANGAMLGLAVGSGVGVLAAGDQLAQVYGKGAGLKLLGYGLSSGVMPGTPETGYVLSIMDDLSTGTPQSQRIAGAIEEGKIGIRVLDEKAFNKAYRQAGGTGFLTRNSPAGFEKNSDIYLRQTTKGLSGMAVHEGTHALDHLNKLDMTMMQAEKRAYFYQRQFNLWQNRPGTDVFEALDNYSLMYLESPF